MLYIDPRLSRHLQDISGGILIDAVFILVEEHQNPLETCNDHRFAEQIIQQMIQQVHESPSFLRFIPRANVVALTASPKFINLLLNHPSIQVASSATIDPFYL